MNDLIDVCLKKSFLLRIRKSDSRWLLHAAIRYLPPDSWKMTDETYELVESNLKKYLVRDIRKRYGNPVIIFILIRIILPIIIRLVIEWWLNQNKVPKKLPAWRL